MKHFSLEKSHFIKLALLDEDQGYINMIRFKLIYSLVTDASGGDSKSIEEAQLDQNSSFAKVNAFISNILSDSLVVKNGEMVEVVMGATASFQNNIIVLPQVHESVLISALHCKLNTIVGKNTFVELVELENLDETLSYKLFCDEGEMEYYDLPQQSEWQGELSYWDTPWWYRYDISTMDRTANNQEEYDAWVAAVESEKVNEMNRMLFEEIDRQILNMYNEEHQDEKSGVVVEVDFTKKDEGPWKPEVL